MLLRHGSHALCGRIVRSPGVDSPPRPRIVSVVIPRASDRQSKRPCRGRLLLATTGIDHHNTRLTTMSSLMHLRRAPGRRVVFRRDDAARVQRWFGHQFTYIGGTQTTACPSMSSVLPSSVVAASSAGTRRCSRGEWVPFAAASRYRYCDPVLVQRQLLLASHGRCAPRVEQAGMFRRRALSLKNTSTVLADVAPDAAFRSIP